MANADPSARRPTIHLRPTRAEEIDAVCAWEQAPENAAFVQVWPEERHRAALRDPTLRHLIIEADGVAVGFILLAGIAQPGSLIEFRRIVVTEKGRGIGTLAVGRVIAYAFDDLGANGIWLDFVEHNERARRVYEHHGFRVVPVERRFAEVAGRMQPLVVMALSREGAPGVTHVPPISRLP